MTDTPRCAAQILGMWHAIRCPNLGKYVENGAHWCGLHRPSAVAARRAKRDAKWEAKWKAQREKWRYAEALRAAQEAAIAAAKAWHVATPADDELAVAQLEDAVETLERLEANPPKGDT